MELHHIRYFAVLARELNYTTAAEKCFISRQALRQSVQVLERDYRVKLIENQRNSLSLTPAGQTLLENAERVLAACDRLEQELGGFAQGGDAIRLGISVSLLPFYAPEVMDAINRLGENLPALKLEPQMQDADSLLRKQDAGELDGVIVLDMGCLKGRRHRTVLRRDRVCVSFSVEHPFALRDKLYMRDLDGRTLVLMSEPSVCFRPLYERAAQLPHGLRYRVVPECFEAFNIVRHEDTIGLDRISEGMPGSVGLEKELPIEDFPQELELVLLTGESPRWELQQLARYLLRAGR